MTSHKNEDLLNLARCRFKDKDYREAITILRYLIKDQDYEVRALANIGACLYQLKHYNAAKKHLNKALSIDPDFMPAQLSLANTFAALGDYQNASTLYGRVTDTDSRNDLAWHGRFDILLLQGETEKCTIHLRQWREQLPESKKLDLAEGILLRQQGNKKEAIRFLIKALAYEPNSPRLHALISELLTDLQQLEDALVYIERAIRLDPEEITYHCAKAIILHFFSMVKECSEAYEKALAICPTSATLLLNQYLLFPIIPASSAEIEHCRAKFEEGLSIVETNPKMELIIQHPMSAHIFPLAYHNQNDRILLERYIQLMKRLAGPLLRQLASTSQPVSSLEANLLSPKIRIGFISRFFCSHSNTLAFEGLIRNMDRSKFHVVIIHAPDSKTDSAQEKLNHFCDEVLYLSKKFNEVYLALRELSLDILYFTDLGMNSYDFLLPMFRACDIQLTGWGIPHTSGNHAIDYYISAEGIEPANADEFYTEELIRLPGGLPCCFIANRQDVPPFPREYFFLPANRQLIGCLQSLHKIHPDFDLVMERIAQHNPDAIFVFVEDANSNSSRLILERLSKNAPNVREQAFFLRIMARGEYQALCQCIDVLLDPIYYGSGITFFEASLVGTPVVTLEGSFFRSRVVSAGYREMALEEPPIAKTIDEYVSLTSELLRNQHMRELLRSKILNKNHLLFNRLDYVRNFEDFCLSIAQKNPI